MTIGSKLDTYTLGNITYAGTPLLVEPEATNVTSILLPDGSGPDHGFPYHFNRTDFFGMVSERKIIIKYKYYDPETGEKRWDNSRSQAHSVYLYGAYSAQGSPDPALGAFAYKAEGVFTYEYQHPHGSPLPFWGYRYKRLVIGNQVYGVAMDLTPQGYQDRVFIDNIALHRIKYPPNPGANVPNGFPTSQHTNGYPTISASAALGWHSDYDYPWYNPVYPEAVGPQENPNPQHQIVWQRGTLWVVGAIAQRRRGFMNRSGSGGDSNPDQGSWNLGAYDPIGPEHFPGGQFVFGGTHWSTGYVKKYYYDERFIKIGPPPHYPQVYSGFGVQKGDFNEETWNFRPPPSKLSWIRPDFRRG
jgi:hypothetical protein